jgi:hypothetical protein
VVVWAGLTIVRTAATYLVVLGASALFCPALAKRFLGRFVIAAPRRALIAAVVLPLVAT